MADTTRAEERAESKNELPTFEQTEVLPELGPEDLRQQLLEHGLITETHWQKVVEAAGDSTSTDAILSSLQGPPRTSEDPTEQGAPTLTPYQVAFIRRGNTARLRFLHYLILDMLGVGGMGQVCRVLNLNVSRVEALKILRPHLDHPMSELPNMERFKREARILAGLNHPAITTLYHAGIEEHQAFIAMEYVDGQTLEKYMSVVNTARGHFPVSDALRIVIEVAEALRYSHEHQVIHRDIKPGNIMITGEGRVKVLDMGVARLFAPSAPERPEGEHTLTTIGDGIGTPAFMPPEQWADATAVTPASDIYSLGCTFYYLLTMSLPCLPDSNGSFMQSHVVTVPPAVSSLRNDVPPALDLVIARMLAKLPDDRFQSAGELIEALRPFASCKPAKSNKARMIAGVSIAAAVLAALVGILSYSPARTWRDDGAPIVTATPTTTAQTTEKAATKPESRIALARRLQQSMHEAREAGNADEVIQIYEEAVEQQAARAEHRAIVAEAYASLGNRARDDEQYVQAIERYDASLRLFPDNVEVIGWRGVANANAGRFESAIEDLRYALKADHDPSQGAEHRKALVHALFERGKQLVDLAEVAEAVAAFRLAADLDPQNAEIHFWLGRVLLNDGQIDAAIDALVAASKLADRPADVFNKLGTAYSQVGKSREAIAAFSRAGQLDPDALAALASCYRGVGVFNLAVENYQHAIREAEEHEASDRRQKLADTYAEWARALATTWQRKLTGGHYEEVIAAYRELMSAHPPIADDAAIKAVLAIAHAREMESSLIDQDYNAAVAHGEEAARLGEDVAALVKAHRQRGIFYLDCATRDARLRSIQRPTDVTIQGVRQLFEYAIQDFQHAVDYDEKDHESHAKLAQILAMGHPNVRNGRKALRHAARACELLSPTKSDYLIILAAAQAQAGQFVEASRLQERVLRSLPASTPRGERLKQKISLLLYQKGQVYPWGDIQINLGVR